MSVRLVKRWKASSIWPGVVFESTTKKLDVRRASTLPGHRGERGVSVSARCRKIKVGVFHNHAPMPASSMPVTVSSSPMTESSEPTTAFPLVFSPFDFWRCE